MLKRLLSFLMTRKQLLGIKERVERAAAGPLDMAA